MNNHSFILKEGTWSAEGQYYDEHQNMVKVIGESVITHDDKEWKLTGFMRLLLTDPIEFYNDYNILPLAADKDYTTWESTNPDIGTLSGKFVFIDETIISSYTSSDGRYSGTEVLIRLDENSYKSRGFVFLDSHKISSWSVELKRKSAGA